MKQRLRRLYRWLGLIADPPAPTTPLARRPLVDRDRLAEQVARDAAAARAARPVRSPVPPDYRGPLSPAELAEAVNLGVLDDPRDAALWTRNELRQAIAKARGRHRLRPDRAGSPIDDTDTTALAHVAGVYHDPAARFDVFDTGEDSHGKTAHGPADKAERVLTESQWRDVAPTPAPSPAPAPSYDPPASSGYYSGGDSGGSSGGSDSGGGSY